MTAPPLPRRGEVWLVPRTLLIRRIGTLTGAKLSEACRALRFAVAC